jgi:hypothetical protein
MTDARDSEQGPVADPDSGFKPGPIIESADGLSPQPTTPVSSSRLRSPILDPAMAPMHVNDGPAFELIVDRRSLAIHASLVVATAAPLVVIGQAGLGVAVAVCTSAILSMRWIGRRAQFGFGDGFVGYRAGLGWPRGIQEEYDVAWGSVGRRQTANQA